MTLLIQNLAGMMPQLAAFGPWDGAVVGIYFIGITVIGFAMARRNPDDKEYFLGGRSMPTWVVAVSIVSSTLSAATFVGVPDQVYKGDISYLILNLGGFVAVFVVALLFVPQLYRAGTVTIYGFLAQRFGEPARLAVSIAFIVGRLLASGSRLFVAAIPLCLLFGVHAPTVPQLILAICAITAVGTFYTSIGGVRAVVWVDAIQLALVVGTALLTIGILLYRIPLSPGEIVQTLASTTQPGTGLSKLQLVDTSLDPTRTFTLWTALIGATFLNVASLGVDHDLAQRFLVAKSAAKGGLSVIASQFISIAVVSMFTVIGLLLFLFYQRPDIMGAAAPSAVPERPESVYPLFLLNELPPVLSGIAITGFFAIAQGSLDSAMNALASSIVADVYVPLRKKVTGKTDEGHAAVSKLTVVGVGGLLCGFAVLCAVMYDPNNKTLLNFVLGVLTFAWTGMLGVFLTALLTKRGNSASVIAALFVGALAVTLMQDSIMKWWTLKLLGKEQTLAWLWWMTIGTVLSFLVCAAGRPRHKLATNEH